MILFPAAVTLLILITAIFLCFFTLGVLRGREADTMINALQISMNQLENELDQIDHAFIEYWNGDGSYPYLSQMTSKEPVETFLEFQLETTDWMEHLISLYDIAEGCFAYYENLDLLLFRGVSNRAVHDYIKTHMTLETYRFSGGG